MSRSTYRTRGGRFLAHERGSQNLRADVIGSLGAQPSRCSGTPPAIRPALRLAAREFSSSMNEACEPPHHP